jgi:glycerol-3-phosphate cytidylyltransferase-like family protein
MIYCFDIDGTFCSQTTNGRYSEAVPFKEVIKKINYLYDTGNTIKIMTGRGCVSGKDYTELTKTQLKNWGVKYHELIMHKKPHADLFIDDRGINIENWMFNYEKISKNDPTRGILAGSFDIIHPGYIEMFKISRINCNHLTIALHEDPCLEKKDKLPVVQSIEDRKKILESIRYIDSVITYKTESELEGLLKSGNYDIRFLGSDYRNKPYTSPDADINIFWIK